MIDLLFIYSTPGEISVSRHVISRTLCDIKCESKCKDAAHQVDHKAWTSKNTMDIHQGHGAWVISLNNLLPESFSNQCDSHKRKQCSSCWALRRKMAALNWCPIKSFFYFWTKKKSLNDYIFVQTSRRRHRHVQVTALSFVVILLLL